jgi:hypothetical protein
MKTRLILKPGQPGTKRLVEKYGESLVCVRFRYDAESRQRLKTVELLVEKTDWNPPQRYDAEALVPVRIKVRHAGSSASQNCRRKMESLEAALVCEVW